MIQILNKYSKKLSDQGLCNEGEPLLGGIDAEVVWNRDSEDIPVLLDVMDAIDLNSILFACPVEPYRSIVFYLAQKYLSDENIKPEDSETRTFLHDIPVISHFDGSEIGRILKQRKSVIILNKGIVTYGTVSPEQAFVTFSSVCFSTFVKFCTDCYFLLSKNHIINKIEHEILFNALDYYENRLKNVSSWDNIKGPYFSQEELYKAIADTGRLTVETGMVDSFFGNVSCKIDDIIYISQTGSSLDELEDNIDPCPINNQRTNAVTASSEFSAHKGVYLSRDISYILHGHPKFSVVVSMLCTDYTCKNRGLCYKSCSKERSVNGIPIIPGEVGTGPTGISSTLPRALKGRGAIV
nr:class II aldolase/adducin family protein [Bacteroidales bacterium]